MPFIPFAAAAGAALGTSAAVGGAAVLAGGFLAAKTATDIINSGKQAKAAKNAANDAANRNAAAIQSVKDAQSSASNNAQSALEAKLRARAGSQSVYTNPLGISGTADVAKKQLLGQ